MQLADEADFAAVAQDPRRATRVQARQRRGLENKRPLGARRSEQRLQVALHVIEISRRRACRADAPLLRQSRPASNTRERVDSRA